MNKVVLSGRLSRNINIFGEGDTAVGKFSLAVKRDFKDKQTGKYECDFINCIAFGSRATTMANFLSKGNMVEIEGKIQTGSYDNKETGQKVYTTDVIVQGFGFLESNNNQQQQSSYDEDLTPVESDDMPF